VSAQATGLRIWAVYDHPADHPEHWVVREWMVTAEETIPGEAFKAETLKIARALIPPGRVRVPRYSGDDPNIVETWL
jgi:hypothetical protein